MSVERLGVVIGGPETKRSADETSAAIASVARQAEKTSTAVTRANDMIGTSTSSTSAKVAAASRAQAAAVASTATSAAAASAAARAHAGALVESTFASGGAAAAAKALTALWATEAAAATATAAAVSGHATAIASSTVATTAATVGAGLFARGLAAIGGPVGLALVGVSALQVGMELFQASSKKAEKAAHDAAEAFKKLSDAQLSLRLAGLESQRAPLAVAQYQAGARGDVAEYQRLAKELAPLQTQITSLTGTLEGLRAKSKQTGDVLTNAFSRELNAARDGLKALQQGGKGAAEAFQLASAQWDRSANNVRSLSAALRDHDPAAVKLIADATALAKAQDALNAAMKPESTREQTKALKDAAKAAKDFQDAYSASLVGTQAALMDAERDAAVGLAKALLSASDAAKKRATATTFELSQQRLQIEAAAATGDEMRKLELRYEFLQKVAQGYSVVAALALASGQQELKDTEEQAKRTAKALGLIGELGGNMAGVANASGGALFGKDLKSDTESWTNSLREALGVASDIAGIFGNVGSELSRAVQLGGTLVSTLAKARTASAAATAARGTANEGATASASNAAGIAAGITGFTAAASAIGYWATSVRQNAEAAREAAIALRELRSATKASLASYVLQANGSPLDQTLAALAAGFKDQVKGLVESGGKIPANWPGRTAVSLVPTAKDFDDALQSYQNMVDAAKKAARAVELAAEQAFQAQQLVIGRQRADFSSDLDARAAGLSGNNGGAATIRLQAQQQQQINAADDLYRAGTITIQMFERLTGILAGELQKALDDAAKSFNDDITVRHLVATGQTEAADARRQEIANQRELNDAMNDGEREVLKWIQGIESVARATEKARQEAERQYSVTRDIDTRTIAALRELDPVKAKELETARRGIDRSKELTDATDDVTRGRLAELHVLEDSAAALQEQIAIAQRVEDATRRVSDAMQSQADAAERLAGFTMDAQEAFLRSKGDNFGADKLRLDRERGQAKTRLGSAFMGSVGPAPSINPNDPQSIQAFIAWQTGVTKGLGTLNETLGIIDQTHDNNYNTLIKNTMGGASAGGVADPSRVFDVTPRGSSADVFNPQRDVVTRVAGGLTEVTAVRWLDIGYSQLSELRQIRIAVTGGGSARGATSVNKALGYELGVDELRAGG